jgi:hypothetical protein
MKWYYSIIFILILSQSGVNISNASQQTIIESFYLHWEIPVTENDSLNTFLPSLYFKGAVYPDSLPQIPLFVHREKQLVPHFNLHSRIIETNIENCSAAETEILIKAGYKTEDFVIRNTLEISKGERFARIEVIPVRFKNGVYEKLLSFSLESELEFDANLKQDQVNTFPDNSVLSDGNWFRVCVGKEGVYKLGKQELESMGIDVSQVQKSTIQLYGNKAGMLPELNSETGVTDLYEHAVFVSGDNFGEFGNDDFILFYGQSPNQWIYNATNDIFEYSQHLYSSETCYFLTYGKEPGLRIESRNSLDDTPSHSVNTFYDYQHHERDLVNLLGSGKIWFGELFDVTLSRNFDFSFDNIAQEPVHINAYLASRASATSSFSFQALGQSASIQIAGVNTANSTGIFARHSIGSISAMPQGNNIEVKLTYNRSVSGAQGWLNYITVNAKRRLTLIGDQMFFRNPSVTGSGNITRFELTGLNPNVTVWDVSEPSRVMLQQLQNSGSEGFFVANTEENKEFVVFRNDNYQKPRLAGKVQNQNLHGMSMHDLVIVVPDIFKSEAERLADFRRSNDNLSVLLVSPQQIYNEFSSGTPDIAAIRNFMKMFYDRAVDTGDYPKYLLLFGNGTYDNKDILGFGGNLIPTFQTRQSLSPASSYISDDFFGLLDETEGLDVQGAIDLGIGRLPVRSVDEARFVVDKLLRYNQRIEGLVPGTDDPRFAGVIPNYADWRNIITLIADDEDSNVHFNQSEQIADLMTDEHPVFNVEKIYLDSYEQNILAGGSRYPDVNKALNNRVNQGALLINYIGHGGTLGLAHERILTFEDILSWGNYYNLPVFMTATCEFSSFDQPDANELSAGVRIFLKPDGGAAALFTTTRLAYSHSNFSLNDAFMQSAFKPMENGEMPRLGDLIRISKVESSSVSTLKNFVLLGDPSMQMAYPKYRAVTTSVPDTIRALEKVTIKGEVYTPDGVFASGYNGVIYPTIFDKKTIFSTLANDSRSSKQEFSMQNRIIFRGAATVENGLFEFSFIVPRDISYNSGSAKISYYFDDGLQHDGCGYYDNIIVAGTSSEYSLDNSGPEILLYMDNRDFVSGDKTEPNPVLLAFLNDESGLNTTGQIGHDIVVFLNDELSNPFIVNNYYQSEMNSFQSGRVVFPFFNLEKGNYTLTLRAWDVHNNVNSESIEFIVTSALGIELTELLNVPNPFSDYTTFSIGHNKPATELNIAIEIYSMSGQLVKSIEQNVYASGFNIPPIEWDGRDDGGTLLDNGIYMFRARVSTEDGDQVQKTEKLLILR